MRAAERVPLPPAGTSASRKADLERFEAQVAEWTALIGQCRAGARRSGAQERQELEGLADELQVRRNEASAQVARLRTCLEAEWEHEKAALERAWRGIHASFREAGARF